VFDAASVPPSLAGATVMVNVSVVPMQPSKVGVTVKVAVKSMEPVFVAVNKGIGEPMPLIGVRPIASVVLVQLKETPVPVYGELASKEICGIRSPLHTVMSIIGLTTDSGFTVIVKFFCVPAHPLISGVTVILAVIGSKVPFKAVNVGNSVVLVPDAASPIAGLSLVQLKFKAPMVGDTGVPDNGIAGDVNTSQNFKSVSEVVIVGAMYIKVSAESVPPSTLNLPEVALQGMVTSKVKTFM